MLQQQQQQTALPTKYMGQNSCRGQSKGCRVLWNSNVHCPVNNSLQFLADIIKVKQVHQLNQCTKQTNVPIKPVHQFPPHFKVLVKSSINAEGFRVISFLHVSVPKPCARCPSLH
jgi:hypothetical protein